MVSQLSIQIRRLSIQSMVRATAPSKGQTQGFARKQQSSSGNKKSSRKKIGRDTLYKNWENTVHTAKLNKSAVSVSLPTFRPTAAEPCLVNAFSNDQYKSLFHMGTFKKGQFNELFPKPVALVRESSTLKFFKLLKESKDRKYILTGEPGVGKTVLLTQIQALAVDSKYLSLHISYPDLFLNGTNNFFYDDASKLYIQPMYLKKLLRKIRKSNSEQILKSIPLKNDYKLANANPEDSSMKPFIQLTAKKNTLWDLLAAKIQPRHRGNQFEGVINEMALQKATPVYFTVDNFSKILTDAFSAYKNVNNKPIYSLDLQMGKIIMNIVSGNTTFANPESAVVLSISGVDRTNRTLPVALDKVKEDPYVSRHYYEPKFVELMRKGNVKEFEVTKLDKDEVKQLLQFYIQSGIVLDKDTSIDLNTLVNEKYFLSGNGNPRELIKSLVLQHR
ncbi:hypothetical protein NCAS_0D04110 [Naumovozyma castellii]|uniref:Small ribosomal subunit protein mS29 n=1 Tax=Naumovozyma castellii TaxID=27288 RepID=G0VEK1_NAUCA|nr:hypothetical protein NCAS_0D04110 [Naumovozyma castellii CBS 4309]CCC69992.1 hypothetical protein NCAS_0D04110 [Naumovozyma castellii CBS 4309]